MQIIILDLELLAKSDKQLHEMTDEEVIELCELWDEDCGHHDIYSDVHQLAANWNSEEIFDPSTSYMRIIEDKD